MEKIIKKIYYGQAVRHEDIEEDKEALRVQIQFDNVCNKLEEMLKEEQREILDILLISHGAVLAVMESLYFQEGLKVGLRLGIEAFED